MLYFIVCMSSISFYILNASDKLFAWIKLITELSDNELIKLTHIL